MLHDGLKAGALEAFPGCFGGFLVGVRADLHTIILISLRRHDKGGEFFLLQVGCEPASVAGSEARRESFDRDSFGRFAAGSDLGATGVGCSVRGLEAARTWPSY